MSYIKTENMHGEDVIINLSLVRCILPSLNKNMCIVVFDNYDINDICINMTMDKLTELLNINNGV